MGASASAAAAHRVLRTSGTRPRADDVVVGRGAVVTRTRRGRPSRVARRCTSDNGTRRERRAARARSEAASAARRATAASTPSRRWRCSRPATAALAVRGRQRAERACGRPAVQRRRRDLADFRARQPRRESLRRPRASARIATRRGTTTAGAGVTLGTHFTPADGTVRFRKRLRRAAQASTSRRRAFGRYVWDRGYTDCDDDVRRLDRVASKRQVCVDVCCARRPKRVEPVSP